MNKAIREENLLSTIDKAQNLYRKELDWMRRQPKARTTKSKSRIDAFFNTEATAKQTIDTKKVMLDMQMTRLGGKVLEMQKVDKYFGEKLTILDQYSYVFQRGDKIGIIGKNGVGKTTFLNILQGLETIDSGKREVGETIVFGYYTQKGLVLPKEDKRVIEYVKDIAEFFPLSNGKELSASQFLKRFLFNDDLQYQYISKLSGGEKKRLHLLSELFKNPNFLILDEPTNDLDLPTLTILEDFLINYKGCLIIISHDRYFMNRVVNHLFVFKGNGVIVDFIGTYNEYIDSEKTPTIENNNNTIKPIKKEEIVVLKTQKISYKQKQEKEKIEITIPLLQEKIENITKQLEVEKNFEVIKNLGEEISQINKEIEALEIKWLELSELAE
ncbi:MAG: ABC-F family ATP-binding cassette domain-containing protein, partial [Solirubrobacteraceae bacterium]